MNPISNNRKRNVGNAHVLPNGNQIFAISQNFVNISAYGAVVINLYLFSQNPNTGASTTPCDI